MLSSFLHSCADVFQMNTNFVCSAGLEIVKEMYMQCLRIHLKYTLA